ncbi:MAG: nitronate monooxygenase [Propioniciclava sp.]|nr:nitronate monooxygenase [Propioniciclava sp.]
MVDLAALFGTRYPLIQAPMAGVQGSALAIAVGQVGALGSLPAAMLSPDALRAELSRLREAGVPYNVNFFAHTPPAPDADAEARWRAALAPYFAELGVAADAPAGPGRAPFSAEAGEVLAAFAPPVVSFHFGLPEPDLLSRVRGWGAVVMSTATTVAEARWLAERGVDVVIAQGLEAGGHRGHFLTDDLSLEGQLPTLDLVTAVVAAVDVPVLAAGGIADAAGVRAAFAAGASGVQVGSAFLCADEATTSPAHRAALAAGWPTALTNVFTGRPARGLVNRAIRELGGAEGLSFSPLAPKFPLAGGAMGPLRAAAEASGSLDFTPLWVGEGAAPRAEPAASIVAALVGQE